MIVQIMQCRPTHTLCSSVNNQNAHWIISALCSAIKWKMQMPLPISTAYIVNIMVQPPILTLNSQTAFLAFTHYFCKEAAF